MNGILTRFGSHKSPLTQGFWRRFNPRTGAETPFLFLPLHGIPTVLSPPHPREASPTAKSGMGFVQYSIDRQPVESALSNVHMFDTNPILADSRLITQSVVNPWDAVTGKVSVVGGFDSPGARWTG